MKKIRAIIAASALLCSTAAACSTGRAGGAGSLEGTWKTVSYNFYGTRMENADLGESTLNLESGGSGTFAMMSEDADDVTWKDTGDGISVRYNDADYSASENGNVLVLNIDGDQMQFYLTKDGAAPRWSAEPKLETASAASASAASAAPSAESDLDENPELNWYGQYSGTFVAGTPSGSMNTSYEGEKDDIYGTIDHDGQDYLELYFDETQDSSTDPILLSTYVTLKKDSLEAAGSDNWMLNQSFTAEDSIITSAVRSGSSPVEITMTGTYHDPSSTSESDGFTWTIQLTRTCEYVCSIDEPQADSSLASSLSSLAMIRGASGGTRNIISPAAAANGSNVVRINRNDELNSYLSAHEKAIIFFWAEWCGPCRMQNSTINDLASEYPDVMFIMCDIDIDGDSSAQYGIRSIPTEVFVRKGKNTENFPGLRTKSWIEDKIGSYFG